VWEGRQLFQLERQAGANGEILRGAVPFHQQGRLCIAVIDLWAEAADFIVRPAYRNLTVSAAASLALLVLSLLAWRALHARQRALLRQAELEHLARLGRLAAVLAHEIRNPLGTIKGFAQLLEEQAAPALKALAAPIITESERLERLVNDLLAYGRPRQPVVDQIQLRALLDQVAESCRRGAGRPLEWEPESVPAEFTLETDPDLLKQILLNLLRNAAEAASASPQPRIVLAARSLAGEVEFEIRDNGPGFSEEALRRAFEPFFTTKTSGTGLGLAISRRLAEVLGGTLEVRNAPEGGALAVLRLPRRAPVAPAGHPLNS
jgi:two-component system sensor histidine kinase HydH